MKILVTFAVAEEFAPWRRRRDFQRVPGTFPLFETRIGSAKVRVILTGMGPSFALEAARQVLPERPDICISSGLAGALRSGFNVGKILAARLVSEVGEPVAVAGHSELLASAVECGAMQIERFATSRTLVGSAAQKRDLGGQAEAVDMESYTILAEAARCGVPAVAIRAISDSADFDMPYDFAAARDARGRIKVRSIIGQVIRHPTGLPALLTFSRDCRFAARSLAEFLDMYTVTLSDRLIPIESNLAAAR